MRIDVHAHYYPEKYIELMGRLGAELSQVVGSKLAGSGQHEIDARIEMMDKAAVTKQVLSVSATHPYFSKEKDAVDGAHLANDQYAELVARYPHRFASFATLPLPHVDAALAEIARALDQLKMAGVTLGTSVNTRSTFDPAFEPMYAELNRREAVVFIHPAGLGLCSPLLNDYGLTWTIGAPFEDTMFVLHAIRSQVPVRFPKIKFVIPHLGGALPMLFNRINMPRVGYPSPLAEMPNVTARRMWYDTVAQGNKAALRCARELFGVEHLVHGSDYPYQLHDAYLNSVQYVEQSGLSAAEVARILDQNALTLLGMDGK
jgi:predicted TIM-barrel fold metal-dependent hydrolase